MTDRQFRTKMIEALEEVADMASLLQDLIAALSVVTASSARVAFDTEDKREAAKAAAKAAIRLRGSLNTRIESAIDALLSGDATKFVPVKSDSHTTGESEM